MANQEEKNFKLFIEGLEMVSGLTRGCYVCDVEASLF